MTCEAAVQIYAHCRVPALNQTAVKQASFFLSKPTTLTVEVRALPTISLWIKPDKKVFFSG